jgi:hypothetical protein
MTLRNQSIVGRSARGRWPVCVLLAAWLVLSDHGQSCEAAGGAADGSSTVAASAEYRYIVSARVRPLLFWIGRDNVGDARIALRTGSDDTRDYELLIGSDPRRAPFAINRWGYILERVSPNRLTLVGVMTESDEDSVEQAQARVSSAGTNAGRFKAIRAHVRAGEAEAAVRRALLPAAPTMRDLDRVLASFPESGMPPQRVSLPAGVSGGFLSTVAGLLDESIDIYHHTGRPASRLRRAFVHGTSVHELVLSSSEAVAYRTGAETERALESQFEVRSTGRTVSRFRITYGTDGRLSRVPLRIVYRPKWWFEAELKIERPGA